MHFRFVGRYTNGHTSITMNGVRFDGDEPSEVPAEAVARLSQNIEFEAVDEKPPKIIAEHLADKPRRGRPKKAAGK